jgi:exosortase
MDPSPDLRPPWVKLAWFSGLLIASFLPVFYQMGVEWIELEEMGHGFFVPLLAGWIVWKDRLQLMKIPVKPNPWGMVLVIWGGCQLIAGTLGAEYFIARTAFLVSMAGVILYLGGWELLKALTFPLCLLLFMIRIPAIMYNQITFPLQLFASSVAESSLWTLGIPALREGNVLELPNQRLQVVEACSGIRSLLSLSFLSLVYAYFFDDKKWMRWALLIATIPIAVAANAFRVTLTGLLGEYKRELAEGFFHTAEGWIVFLIALGALASVHQLIDRVWRLYARRRVTA